MLAHWAALTALMLAAGDAGSPPRITIRGVVRDQRGAPFPLASVRLTRSLADRLAATVADETGDFVQRERIADAAGRFEFLDLPPARYELVAVAGASDDAIFRELDAGA